jgi:hypothetical protein
MSIKTFSTSAPDGNPNLWVCVPGVGYYSFENSAERRRVTKALKRGIKLQVALQCWDTEKFEEEVNKLSPQGDYREVKLRERAQSLEKSYTEEDHLPYYQYDWYVNGDISFDDMSPEWQEWATDVQEDRMDIFGYYEDIEEKYAQGRRLELWNLYEDYYVPDILGLPESEILWIIDHRDDPLMGNFSEPDFIDMAPHHRYEIGQLKLVYTLFPRETIKHREILLEKVHFPTWVDEKGILFLQRFLSDYPVDFNNPEKMLIEAFNLLIDIYEVDLKISSIEEVIENPDWFLIATYSQEFSDSLVAEITSILDPVSTIDDLINHPLVIYYEQSAQPVRAILDQVLGSEAFLEKLVANLKKAQKQYQCDITNYNWSDWYLSDSDFLIPEVRKFVEFDFTRFIYWGFERSLEVFKPSIPPVKEETYVIPYKGQTAISCSTVAMEEDYKWNIEGAKVWASTDGIISQYGDNPVLAFVDTRGANRIPFRLGSYSDTWESELSYGIDHYYGQYGAITFNNKLKSKVVPVDTTQVLQSFIKEDCKIIHLNGKLGWFTTSGTIWSLVYEDGLCVKGEKGLPEFLAYAKGFLSTEKEKGLPLAQLFLVRLVLIALGLAKKTQTTARAAGYQWLGHYALGTGADKMFPKEWLEPVSQLIISTADKDGNFFIPSTSWEGSGFDTRPHGFYTVGGFSGHYDRESGVVEFEDVYDWHPMERTSPVSYQKAEVWCWSETSLPEIDLELLVKYLPKMLQPLAVKALRHYGWTNINLDYLVEKILGPQYFGDSQFFGVYGFSNKLWADLERVGARTFKTKFKGII